VLWGAILI